MQTVDSLSELEEVAKRLLLKLTAISSRQAKATVLAISGDLGSGKTTLVQMLARQLGVTTTVTSPTFTIMKVYQLTGQFGFDRLVHIDAYRIETLAELQPLRLTEYLATPRTLLCIEWAELIADALPSDSLLLMLGQDKAGVRTATLTPPLT